MNETTERLILQRLDEIANKIDSMRESLHAGERRMDGFERTIETLINTDDRQELRVDALEKKVSDLEPVREMLQNMKKILYMGLAIAGILTAMPWLQKFISK